MLGRIKRLPLRLLERLTRHRSGRVVVMISLWVLLLVGFAQFATLRFWATFIAGALLPVSLCVSYEGFWIPRPGRFDHLLRLTPSQFEHAVARLMEPLGFTQVRVVGGANDRGVDVVCRDPDDNIVAIQCKRFLPDNPITSAAVQTFIGGMAIYKASKGIIVTTSTFSSPARELAYDQGVRLIDGSKLVSLMDLHLPLFEHGTTLTE